MLIRFLSFVFVAFSISVLAQDRNTQLSKQYEDLLAAHRPAIEKATKATVNVVVDGRQRVLGTVIHPAGWVLTKGSELGATPKTSELRILAGEDLLPARFERMFKDDDLILIKAETTKPLAAVSFTSGKVPAPGTFIAAAGPNQKNPLGIGVLSVAPREIPYERAFLGVSLDTAAGKVLIDEVIEGSAAAAAGIKDKDEVVRMNGKVYPNAGEFIEAVGKLEPGDTANLVIKRGEETLDFAVQLRKRSSLPAERQNRFDRMNRMGGELSRRANGFQSAFQTDLPVSPEECGGPVCDLEGKALGICVARAGRIKTYVVPASRVAKLVQDIEFGSDLAAASSADSAAANVPTSGATRGQVQRSLKEVRAAIKALQAAEQKLLESLDSADAAP